MTKEDYDNAIMSIIISGRGYQAIADIIYHLATEYENRGKAVMEYRVDQNKIYDICENRDIPDGKKVKAIRAIVG